jgi:hypothetical protein
VENGNDCAIRAGHKAERRQAILLAAENLMETAIGKGAPAE